MPPTGIGAGLTRAQIHPLAILRFHRKYRMGDGCWEWMAGCGGGGYGHQAISFNADTMRGVTTTAHRIAYVLAHGPIPVGMVVMHTCDNRLCVKPSHLRLGTQGDNIRDCDAKGRNPKRNRKAV